MDHKGQFETKRSCAIKEYRAYGTTIKEKLYADDEKNRYFHLYHKPSRENAERTQLENLLQRMAEMSKKPNYMTVPAALRELEKIELIW